MNPLSFLPLSLHHSLSVWSTHRGPRPVPGRPGWTRSHGSAGGAVWLQAGSTFTASPTVHHLLLLPIGRPSTFSSLCPWLLQLHGFKKSSHRIFRLNNIAKVLSFLEQRNVSVSDVLIDILILCTVRVKLVCCSGEAGQYRCSWCCRRTLVHHPGTHLEHHPLFSGQHSLPFIDSHFDLEVTVGGSPSVGSNSERRLIISCQIGARETTSHLVSIWIVVAFNISSTVLMESLAWRHEAAHQSIMRALLVFCFILTMLIQYTPTLLWLTWVHPGSCVASRGASALLATTIF